MHSIRKTDYALATLGLVAVMAIVSVCLMAAPASFERESLKGQIHDKPLLTAEQKAEAEETGFAAFRDSSGWNVIHVSNIPREYL